MGFKRQKCKSAKCKRSTCTSNELAISESQDQQSKICKSVDAGCVDARTQRDFANSSFFTFYFLKILKSQSEKVKFSKVKVHLFKVFTFTSALEQRCQSERTQVLSSQITQTHFLNVRNSKFQEIKFLNSSNSIDLKSKMSVSQRQEF